MIEELLTEEGRGSKEARKARVVFFLYTKLDAATVQYMIQKESKDCQPFTSYSLRKCNSKFNRATTFEQSLSPVSISGN
jgi:hypothetical protein